MPELVKDRLWMARDEEHLADIISDEIGWLHEGLECEVVELPLDEKYGVFIESLMTTWREPPVVDNPETTAVSSTKNTKENRTVLVATFHEEAVFKLPNNLDLEDKSVVKEYWVRWGELFISYTSLENWEKYTNQAEDEDDIEQEVSCRNLPSPQWIQAIRLHIEVPAEQILVPAKTEIVRLHPGLNCIGEGLDCEVEYEQDA
jgi:hypothetical protein